MTKEEAMIRTLAKENDELEMEIGRLRQALEKKPCEDAVSRQAALGALNCEISGSIESDIDLSKYTREFQEFANMILNAQEKAIQALPSVAPTRKVWIPVSERLPEDGTWNIFTNGKKISVERYKADALDHFYPSGRWFSLEDAIAWMPLPELYKADMRGGEQ